MNTNFVITPFILINDDQLIDAQVQATVYGCAPFSYETFIGVITEVKLTRYGKFAYFTTPALVGGKWIKISQILGFAHIEETPVPAAAVATVAEMTVAETREHIAALADDFPAVALDVLLDYDAGVAAAEMPVVAQPAHMTDAGRRVGQIAHINAHAGYGYIRQAGATDDVRFLVRSVCGGDAAVAALTKGMTASFAEAAGLAAVVIVVPGHEGSEAHYASYVARKSANKAHVPLPRARRREVPVNPFTSLRLS